MNFVQHCVCADFLGTYEAQSLERKKMDHFSPSSLFKHFSQKLYGKMVRWGLKEGGGCEIRARDWIGRSRWAAFYRLNSCRANTSNFNLFILNFHTVDTHGHSPSSRKNILIKFSFIGTHNLSITNHSPSNPSFSSSPLRRTTCSTLSRRTTTRYSLDSSRSLLFAFLPSNRILVGWCFFFITPTNDDKICDVGKRKQKKIDH